jgi:hypothetical protein
MNGGWILSFSPFKEKINKKIIKKNGWKREIDTNSEEENERQMGEEEDPSPYMCVTVKDDLIISHNFFHSLYFIFYYKIRLKKLTSQLSHLSDLAHQRWLGQNYHFTKMRKDGGNLWCTSTPLEKKYRYQVHIRINTRYIYVP